jgi:hypothetical protein
MPWYDAVNKFIRKDYPGSYKQSAAGPLKSDRILGSMAKAPRGPRGNQVIRKRTAFPKRQPVKRKSTKKRKRLAPRGKFKKPKKVRKVSPKYHNHRIEFEGTCNAGQAFMYVGVNNCGHRTAIWQAMSDAVLRPILAKEFKFYPLQDTDKIGNMTATTGPISLVFDMKRVTGIGGVDQVIRPLEGTPSDANLALLRLDTDDQTYDQMRTRMMLILSFWADASDTSPPTSAANVAPSSDRVGYFPCKYTVVASTTTSASTTAAYVLATNEHVGDTMIDLRFSQTIMFVNRTLAEGGSAAGQDLDRLGTNPLKGKLYEFNHSAPRILDHVDMSTTLRNSIQSDTTNGMAKYTSTDAADSHLAHPLSAKYWLKNCQRESSIMLQPGQTKSHTNVHSIKGKLSTLIERLYFAGYDKGTFGSSSLFMFDMVHKSDQTPTTTYKRMIRIQSYGKLRSPKIYIPDFEAAVDNL